MKCFFTIEAAKTRPDRLGTSAPQVKIVRHHMVPSSGLFRWRQMDVQLVLLRNGCFARQVIF
jgi:hypothetical protein